MSSWARRLALPLITGKLIMVTRTLVLGNLVCTSSCQSKSWSSDTACLWWINMANLLLLKRRQMSCTLELYWFCALPTTDNGPVKMTIYQHSQQDPAAGKDPLHGSHAACGCCKRARQSESMYAQLVNVMSRIITHNRLRDGSLENTTWARGTKQVKLSAWSKKSWLFSWFSLLSRVHMTP